MSARERGAWVGRLMLSPQGAKVGRGFEEADYFCFVYFTLHTILNAPLLEHM